MLAILCYTLSVLYVFIDAQTGRDFIGFVNGIWTCRCSVRKTEINLKSSHRVRLSKKISGVNNIVRRAARLKEKEGVVQRSGHCSHQQSPQAYTHCPELPELPGPPWWGQSPPLPLLLMLLVHLSPMLLDITTSENHTCYCFWLSTLLEHILPLMDPKVE